MHNTQTAVTNMTIKRMLENKRNVKLNQFLFSNMRFIVMFVTAVCVLFLIKLRWPKKKNICLDLLVNTDFFFTKTLPLSQ